MVIILPIRNNFLFLALHFHVTLKIHFIAYLIKPLYYLHILKILNIDSVNCQIEKKMKNSIKLVYSNTYDFLWIPVNGFVSLTSLILPYWSTFFTLASNVVPSYLNSALFQLFFWKNVNKHKQYNIAMHIYIKTIT